ncbi:MAG: class I SAM-dependent methyltransferase [Myxococcales bacterium]
MSFLQRVAAQFRKPEGLAGRLVARLMERGNRAANEWTLDLLGLRTADDVLEIGFGHGAALGRALELAPQGRVVGADFSQTMVEQAGRRHAAAIAAGRVRLFLGGLGELPRWPDVRPDLRRQPPLLRARRAGFRGGTARADQGGRTGGPLHPTRGGAAPDAVSSLRRRLPVLRTCRGGSLPA